MVQHRRQTEDELNRQILGFCREIAGKCEIVAVCLRGDYAPILPAEKNLLQTLLVVHDYQPRLRNHVKIAGQYNVLVLAVDEWVFERDVERGFLGEALAGVLIFPYDPLANSDYLRSQEIVLKERLSKELLQSLVLDFPELSSEFHIRPEYLLYGAMLTRARLFPPTMYSAASLFRRRDRKTALEDALKGFAIALGELEQQGITYHCDGCFKLSAQFIEKSKSPKSRFTDLFRAGQRAMFTSLLGIFPQVLDALWRNAELFLKLQAAFVEDSRIRQEMIDPENYVYLSTTSGLVPLANRVDIEGLVRSALSTDKKAEVKIQSIGGILNDVYLVETRSKGKLTKVVVKRFRDWSNFKWFPLTLWSVGTRTFTVLGSSRLERECATNRFLDAKGFSVPGVLHVSPKEGLLVMEYIEGEDFSSIVKKAGSSKNDTETECGLALIQKVGEIFAKVHALRVALGDTKPENIRVGKQQEIYLMDFEQAARNGDRTWDIAEFLYYAGHDISPFAEPERLNQIAQAFIRGYSRAGGNIKAVEDAGRPKYTKVFSVFTFPHIMLAFSTACKKAGKTQK